MLFSGSISSSDKTNGLLALAPTPYPTVSVSEDYTVVESDAIKSQSSRNIEVLSPLAGDSVSSGFAVKGNARMKDNTVVIRLSDSNGNILIETTAITNSPSTGDYGPFEKIINFSSEDKSGLLDIFQFNKNDGSITDMVTIPLNFK